eukprot:2403687-Rhodomonas_salina.1
MKLNSFELTVSNNAALQVLLAKMQVLADKQPIREEQWRQRAKKFRGQRTRHSADEQLDTAEQEIAQHAIAGAGAAGGAGAGAGAGAGDGAGAAEGAGNGSCWRRATQPQ